MMNKFVVVWSLSCLCLEISIAEKSSWEPKESFDESQCNFNISQIYNVTSLLRCMDELAVDLLAQNNGRSLRQPGQSNSLDYDDNPHQFPYGDLILNLFNNDVSSIFQDSPSDPAASYYQSNRPLVPSGPSDGFGLNLLDALSSISRYDDLKCVPRILCEVASGRLPGEYKRAPTGAASTSDFGRNVLMQCVLSEVLCDNGERGVLPVQCDAINNAILAWLAGLDIAGTSPVLNFVRATALGYSARADPIMCYRAYPRCPRNSDKLVHYLNNHNGGFFRFFGGRKSYSQSRLPYRPTQADTKFLGGGKRKAPPPGYAGAEADRTGTGELRFDIIPALSARRDYGRSFFPKENTPESFGRVVFPIHEESTDDRPSGNRIPKSLSELRNFDTSTPPPFFPQESEELDDRAVRFSPQTSVPYSDFQFPR